MTQKQGVLDYARPLKGVRLRSIAAAFAMLIVFAVVGAGIGAAVGRSLFRPMYVAQGCLTLEDADSRVPRQSIIPQQWPLQLIVANALPLARQVQPNGRTLSLTPSEALAHARLAPIAQTDLVMASYTADDPAVAACMAKAILDACVSTPATYNGGTRLVAQIIAAPLPPIRPHTKFPLLGGLGGAFAGMVLYLAWMVLRRIRPKWAI